MQIRGSIGLVTGGASGLGAAVVRMLVDGGGRAAVVDRTAPAGPSLGDDAAFFAADLRRSDDVGAAVAGAVRRFGRIDVVVNCAGISPCEPVVGADGAPHPLELFRHAVDVNLVGLFDVVSRCAAAMARNPPGPDGERGLIVNAASIAGIEGKAGQAAYAATKGAVIAMTLPLARDLGAHGIRVVTIAPGVMDTPMLDGLADAERQALVAEQVFPRRLGRPEEFAAVVRAAMESTLLNGVTVRLDAAARLGAG